MASVGHPFPTYNIPRVSRIKLPGVNALFDDRTQRPYTPPQSYHEDKVKQESPIELLVPARAPELAHPQPHHITLLQHQQHQHHQQQLHHQQPQFHLITSPIDHYHPPPPISYTPTNAYNFHPSVQPQLIPLPPGPSLGPNPHHNHAVGAQQLPVYYCPVQMLPYAPQPTMIEPLPKQAIAWSNEDDNLLRHLKEVKKLGWKEIANHFPRRTPNACQFRWRRIVAGIVSPRTTTDVPNSNVASKDLSKIRKKNYVHSVLN